MADYRTVASPWSMAGNSAELQAAKLAGRVELAHPEFGIRQLNVGDQPIVGQILGVRRTLSTTAHQEPPLSRPLKKGDRHAHDIKISRRFRDSPRASPLFQQAVSAALEELPPWPMSESYVRGQDLVATYAAADDWPYVTQIYWRAAEPSIAADGTSSVALLVSLHTPLLDTWPKMFIDSQLAADEVLAVTCDAENRSEVQSVTRAAYSLQPTGATCIVWRLMGQRISYLETIPAGDARQLTMRRTGKSEWHSRWELFADFLEKGVICRARLESMFVPRAHDLEFARAACESIGTRPLPLTA